MIAERSFAETETTRDSGCSATSRSPRVATRRLPGPAIAVDCAVPGTPGPDGNAACTLRIEPLGSCSNQRLATMPLTRGGAPVDKEEWPGPVSVLRCR